MVEADCVLAEDPLDFGLRFALTEEVVFDRDLMSAVTAFVELGCEGGGCEGGLDCGIVDTVHCLH